MTAAHQTWHMTKLLSILLSVVSIYAADIRVTRHATEFTLPGPQWQLTTDADTPETSWKGMLTLYAGVSATIPLNTTLPAGTYVVAFKVLDYDQGHQFSFTLGGTTVGGLVFNDRETDSLLWMPPQPVVTGSDATTITLNVTRVGLRDMRLMAVFISSNTNDFIFRDDRRMTFQLPTVSDVDVSAAVAGNLVPNASFELGVGPFWRMLNANGATRTNYLQDMWSTDHAHHGTHSVKLPVPSAGNIYIASNPILFRSTNKAHTVTVRVKSEDNPVTANLYVISMYDAPDGFTPTYAFVTSTTVSPADGWKLLSLSFTNWAYPNGQYSISVLNQRIGGLATDMYVDSLQVEEGLVASTFAPQYPFEFDVEASHVSKVLHTDDSPELALRYYNNTGSPINRDVIYQVRNWTNVVSLSNTVAVTAASGFGSTPIALGTNELGHFRITASLTNQFSTELAYLLTTPPPVDGYVTNSGFGIHVDHSLASLGVAKRAGFKQQVGVSTARVRWSEVENPSNVFTFPDLQYFNSNSIVVTINLLEATPSWYGTNVANYTNGPWQRWVTNTVAHYKTRLNGQRRYEIANEPDQAEYLPGASATERLNFYASLVAIAAPLIKSYDPDALVVAGGGVLTPTHLDTFWAHLSAPIKAQVDLLSVHIYPGNEVIADDLQAWAIANGKTGRIINTESGSGTKGSYTGARAPFRDAGDYITGWKAGDWAYDSFFSGIKAQSHNFIQNQAYDINYNAYYDLGARNIEPFDFSSRQFTVLDYDDSLRAIAGFLITNARLLDQANGYGSASQDARLSAFAFTDASGLPIGALWGSSNLTVQLSGAATNQFRIYDVMGNSRIPASVSLPVWQIPIFIKGESGITIGTLTNWIWGATVSGRLDVNAPNLSLEMTPQGIGNHWRWIALDEYTPNESDPYAIQYRHALNFSPSGTNWTPWTGQTWVNQTATNIIVQARDAAGNVSTLTSDGGSSSSGGGSTGGGGATNPPVIIGGDVKLGGMVNLRTL